MYKYMIFDDGFFNAGSPEYFNHTTGEVIIASTPVEAIAVHQGSDPYYSLAGMNVVVARLAGKDFGDNEMRPIQIHGPYHVSKDGIIEKAF